MLKTNPMVEFFERLEYKIIQSESSWWYEVQPGVLLTLPYYKTIAPSEAEIRKLFREHHLRLLRFPAKLDQYGFESNITVNTHKDYDFEHLHQKARNQTRRGLENCEVGPISFDILARKGLRLNIDTAQRQNRESQYCSESYWNKYCKAASETPGVHAWGAFCEGELASFLVATETEGNWVEWIVNHSDTSLRNKYANNALAFKAGQFFLREKGCAGICYGLGSLEDTTYLDHFKKRMGWEIKTIKQRLVFSNKLKLIAGLAPEPLMKIANKLCPKSYTVRKATAMFRLYRQQNSDVIENECKG